VLTARDIEPLFEEPSDGLNSYNSFNSYMVAEKKPVLEPEALYGLAGEIVKAIDPYTESDPVAVLTNTLTAFGNVVGPIPYFRVENTRIISTFLSFKLAIQLKGGRARGGQRLAGCSKKSIGNGARSE
jgi:hypothetical protein